MALDVEPRHVIDTVAGVSVVGTLTGYLPIAAAILAIIWYLIQIWESRTCRNLVARMFKRDG